MPLNPPYLLIRDGLLKGRVIPLLGSGASIDETRGDATLVPGLGSYLPSANELARHLAEKAGFPEEEELRLTKVAQYYDVVGGRKALNDELHSIFDCDYPLTPVHTFLADIDAPLLIVTTNYDDCIERALKLKNRKYDLVIHTTDTAAGDHLLWWEDGKTEPMKISPNKLDLGNLDDRTVVYKMHGAVDRIFAKRDQYVITEDDYIDFLSRMTKNKAVPAIFAEPFQSRHFLFLGYALSDWNLRVVLNRIEKDLRRPKGIRSWAVQQNPSPLEQRFWQERGVEVYNKPLDEFIRELTSREAHG
ncbi:MAG: SIR2 family protein [Acidobacteriota bacterium]